MPGRFFAKGKSRALVFGKGDTEGEDGKRWCRFFGKSRTSETVRLFTRHTKGGRQENCREGGGGLLSTRMDGRKETGGKGPWRIIPERAINGIAKGWVLWGQQPSLKRWSKRPEKEPILKQT